MKEVRGAESRTDTTEAGRSAARVSAVRSYIAF